MKECLACGNQRDLNDGGDPLTCPGCGRVYAKVEAAHRVAEAAKAENAPPPPPNEPGRYKSGFWSELGETKRTLIFVAVALGVGFFAGRIHMQYTILSSFTAAVAGIGEAFTPPAESSVSNSSPSPENPSPPPSAKPAPPPRNNPVTSTLLKKGFRTGEYGQGRVTFDVRFTNETERAIRGFNGVIVIEDVLGNVIKQLRVKITDPISAGGTTIWSGEMEYNQFVSSDRELRTAEFQDIAARFRTTKVLFQDGEVVEYN